jgi:hypothetical protein
MKNRKISFEIFPSGGNHVDRKLSGQEAGPGAHFGENVARTAGLGWVWYLPLQPCLHRTAEGLLASLLERDNQNSNHQMRQILMFELHCSIVGFSMIDARKRLRS